VTERGRGRGGGEAQLRLPRARLAGELGDLALAQAAAEEVVDAVAARGEEVQTAELRLDPGAVENLEREGGREGGREGAGGGTTSEGVRWRSSPSSD
jgi:hypothetical protein